MPCSYYSPEEERQISADRIHKLTRLLCAACRTIENLGGHMSDELAAYWKAHQKMDKERKAAEQAERERKRAARIARRKLTKAERRALDLTEEE